MKVESEKVALNLNIQKTKIMASGPITSWQIDGESGAIVAEGFADSGVVAPLLIPNLVSCLLVGRHYCK